jgi:hypothetical protein
MVLWVAPTTFPVSENVTLVRVLVVVVVLPSLLVTDCELRNPTVVVFCAESYAASFTLLKRHLVSIPHLRLLGIPCRCI